MALPSADRDPCVIMMAPVFRCMAAV
jgi:hypothetical protein